MNEQKTKIDLIAIMSLSLAIAGIFLGLLFPGSYLGLLFFPLAPIVGAISLFRIYNSKGRLKGKVLAFSGTILPLVLLVSAYIIFMQNLVPNKKPKREICIANLKQIGKAIEKYADDHEGHYFSSDNIYPASEEGILLKEGYLNKPIQCPVTMKNYIYEFDNNSNAFTIHCPNPEDHYWGPKLGQVLEVLLYNSEKGIVEIQHQWPHQKTR